MTLYSKDKYHRKYTITIIVTMAILNRMNIVILLLHSVIVNS